MGDRLIEVVAYSGHKAEECPRSFSIGGEKIDIAAVRNMWIEEQADGRRKSFFEVKGRDGFIYTIYYDEHLFEWFLTGR